jgi:hypothetical protein
MTVVKLAPVDVERIRLQMLIALAVTPRHIFKGLWEPHSLTKDGYRQELVAKLTSGWEDRGQMEPAKDEIGRLIYEEG